MLGRCAVTLGLVFVLGCSSSGDTFDGDGVPADAAVDRADTAAVDAPNSEASADAAPCPTADCPYMPAGPVSNCGEGICDGQAQTFVICSAVCGHTNDPRPLQAGTTLIRTAPVTAPDSDCACPVEGFWVRWFFRAPKGFCVRFRGPENMAAKVVNDGDVCTAEMQACSGFTTGNLDDKTIAVGIIGAAPTSIIRIDVTPGICSGSPSCTPSCNGE